MSQKDKHTKIGRLLLVIVRSNTMQKYPMVLGLIWALLIWKIVKTYNNSVCPTCSEMTYLRSFQQVAKLYRTFVPWFNSRTGHINRKLQNSADTLFWSFSFFADKSKTSYLPLIEKKWFWNDTLVLYHGGKQHSWSGHIQLGYNKSKLFLMHSSRRAFWCWRICWYLN